MSSYYEEDEAVEEDEEEEDDGTKLPRQVAELAEASTPNNLRGIRACKRCGILKTMEQFFDHGCENCPFLEMIENDPRCMACTTAFFEGQVAVMDPRESWVAKWLRVDNYLPGVYAIVVIGTFDNMIKDILENRGCRWRCKPIT